MLLGSSKWTSRGVRRGFGRGWVRLRRVGRFLRRVRGTVAFKWLFCLAARMACQILAGVTGIFRRNFIGAVNAGTITIGIDGTGVAVANAINLIDNRYGVSPGAGATKNFDNTDVSLVNNYYGTIGAGAGFVIHTIAV